MISLQDHFHPPLSVRRHWHAFHNAWATYIAADLNDRLPPGYFAEPNVQFAIEIEVAADEEAPTVSSATGESARGGAALAEWIPPAPVQTLPLNLPSDTVEVLVFSDQWGPTLAGAIELVSPGNQDRPAHQEAFVSKCEAYLQQGIGLVIVDVVTERGADLHRELMAHVAPGEHSHPAGSLYAAAYHPVSYGGSPSLDLWLEALQIGQPLVTMPLWLRGSLCIPVRLAETYERACRELRLI